jgi:hypothetical protein
LLAPEVGHTLAAPGPAAAMCVITAKDQRDHPHAVTAMHAAIAAAQRGDWRECVDSYKTAFKKSGDALSPLAGTTACRVCPPR